MNLLYRPFYKMWKALVVLRLMMRSRAQTFTAIYQSNWWRDAESRSGTGSNLQATAAIRRQLPALLAEYEIKSMLDIPCGDMHWMSKLDLPVERYIGADIVQEMVDETQAKHGAPGREFMRLDLASDALPRTDLVFCRDCLVHLSFKDGLAAIDNIKRSGSKYLLTTTYPNRASNKNIVTGMWRQLNLQQAPFHFPEPIRLIDEECEEADGTQRDKSLGLWRIADL